MCKRKYFKLDDNQYIISFYQCITWGLYIYWQQKIKELENEELAKPIQISYLENVQICQYRLYLISEFGYYLFWISKMNEVQFSMYFEYPGYFRNLLLSSNCQSNYNVQYNQSINSTIIFQNTQQYIIQFQGTDIQIEQMENIVIAKTQNQLTVIYNQEYQQVIQLNTLHITIDNNYNLIYWLDEITKELIFYKISYPKNIIQPSKHVQVQNQKKICYKLKYIIEHQYNKNQTLDFNYQCQNESSTVYSKEGLQLPHKYEIKLDQNLEFRLNILDQYSFQSICPKHYNFNPNDTILLYFETNTNISFSMIQTKDYIYFQNCHNSNKSRVDIQNCQVFYFQSYILLHNQKKQELQLFGFQDILIRKFRIQIQITDIVQYQQIFLIFTSDSKDPKIIDLSKRYQIILNKQTNKILNALHQIYFQDKQQNQNLTTNHFFINFENQKLFQYNQYLIILIHKNVQMIRLENIQIIFLKQLLNLQYYLLGVHLINNSINDYHFDSQQVSVLSSFKLDHYELIKPLKYQINKKYLALASLSENKTYVLIFEIRITKPLLLVKVIQISRIEFFFLGYQLFYYNFEDEINIYNLLYFEVQLQDSTEHNEIAVKTNITFQIISEMKSEPTIYLGFTLKFYNECYRLFQKSNHSSINSTQNHIIPSKYFYGSIDLLKIEVSNETNILEPLRFIEWIDISRLRYEGRIKKIDIGPILFINQSFNETYSIYIVLADNDLGQTFIINPTDQLFVKILPINNQYILFFFDQVNFIQGAMYLIDEDTQNLIKEPIQELNITLNQSYSHYLIFKTGDLIVFKSKSQLLLYMILNSSIKFIENDLYILDILKVQGNNQFYISFSQLRDRQAYYFHVLSINQFNLVSIGTAILQLQTIFIELQAYVQILLYEHIDEKSQISILDCEIIDQEFRIQVFQIFNKIQIISQICIKIENYSISFKVLNILRHELGDKMKLQFYNKNHLILQSLSNSYYFYDLKEPLNFIDYFGSIIQNNDLYYPFNTTHLYVFQRNTSQIYLAELGYKIDTQSHLFENQIFTLVAENQLSQARCRITINENSHQEEDNNFLIKLVIVLVLILIFYFLLRRIQLKRKQLNNQRHHHQTFAKISNVEE
ncbi:unnamed protein product (macronuclear) [Paramecium tetraurelia]|uniref:Transmembrane protein n=1 Tax=Paramecium tetraurelia TaxID=5888 RepID=A0CAL5_PARTE|nr:uncharacterized protein GSPATT00036612001 [Paramecium tetraurelia]CAK67832.1 unnamed protein product [Paramecium tetraurelia]|eukprot:XP_001435229.1 hypothetical protein (macronuclear) [Paramecium tetraurelia strain d4-2]